LKVLVTGASGQVGRALQDTVPSGVEMRALTHAHLDISDAAAVRRTLADFSPAVVINAAAYTAVDRAESEPAAAAAINAAGPRHLAEGVLGIASARLLHISTDYVFDGRGTTPRRTEDSTAPLSVYGRSKLAGERAVLELLGNRAVVLRTAWVYAAAGSNFVLTMLRLMRERGAVRVVSDQYGSPTAAASVARALWRIAALPEVHGVLHWTDAGTASWYEFACAIAADAQAEGLLARAPEVTPITTAEYPTPAPRPRNSTLELTASAAQLGLQPVPWRDNLRTTLRALARA
jgi:dTDP-4-dehydrorhamnose reductase